MAGNQFLVTDNSEDESLKLEALILDLEREIKRVEGVLIPFEQLLRNKVSDLIIEERELTMLYKEQKLEKKEKRLAQKKRGKNYIKPVGLITVNNTVSKPKEKVDVKEKKRLYKEAMMYVHPDKFSIKEDNEDLATVITTKLIQIYKTGTLEELQAYHSYIFNGNISEDLRNASVNINTKVEKNRYLKNEIDRLENILKELLERHTYKVVTQYINPMLFADELIEYYNGRIFKLRKRTRTK